MTTTKLVYHSFFCCLVYASLCPCGLLTLDWPTTTLFCLVLETTRVWMNGTLYVFTCIYRCIYIYVLGYCLCSNLTSKEKTFRKIHYCYHIIYRFSDLVHIQRVRTLEQNTCDIYGCFLKHCETKHRAPAFNS